VILPKTRAFGPIPWLENIADYTEFTNFVHLIYVGTFSNSQFCNKSHHKTTIYSKHKTMYDSFARSLKAMFTSHWLYMAVRAACQLSLFDLITQGQNTIDRICTQLNADPQAMRSLLTALQEHQLLLHNQGEYALTLAGELLTETHPQSLKQSCILWGGEHLQAWQQLSATLITGRSAFDLALGQPYFEQLQNQPDKLRIYHSAMREYALTDYKHIAQCFDFDRFDNIADLGGGLGVLLYNLLDAYPMLQGILFDLPEVSALAKETPHPRASYHSGSFFEPLPFRADAIVLSRIIHDWPDPQAEIILQNCHNAINPGGILFLVEHSPSIGEPHLLSLNMMLMCGSCERSIDQYVHLMAANGFEHSQTLRLNSLQVIIVAKKV
jgi:predicted transcriptional regulator